MFDITHSADLLPFNECAMHKKLPKVQQEIGLHRKNGSVNMHVQPGANK